MVPILPDLLPCDLRVPLRFLPISNPVEAATMALMAWHGMTADDVVKEFAPVHGNLTVVRVRAYHRAAAQRFQMPTAAVRHLLFDAYCALPGSPRARAKTLAEILANGWDITRGASR